MDEVWYLRQYCNGDIIVVLLLLLFAPLTNNTKKIRKTKGRKRGGECPVVRKYNRNNQHNRNIHTTTEKPKAKRSSTSCRSAEFAQYVQRRRIV
jgi:hypothetical protein